MSKVGRHVVAISAGLLVFLAVPGWMGFQNYGDHDRSHNQIPRSYAYNLLTSVKEDAILFTNGDNDTYPLWYLQNVEGVRTDVRVVNLSLLNTHWYIRQLKEQASYESAPLPISLSNNQIQSLRPKTDWSPREVRLPVGADSSRWNMYRPVKAERGVTVERPMTWTLKGRPLGGNRRYLSVADQVVYNILKTNAEQGWKRPIYFATTVSPDGQLNLQNYFQHEGQAYRVLPIRHDRVRGRVTPKLTVRRVRGFQFGGLQDTTNVYNWNARRMVDSYRSQFAYAAHRLAKKGYAKKAIALLKDISSSVPAASVPGSLPSWLSMARAYRTLGKHSRRADVMRRAAPLILHRIKQATTKKELRWSLRLANRVRMSYKAADRPEALDAFEKRLKQAFGSPPPKIPEADS